MSDHDELDDIMTNALKGVIGTGLDVNGMGLVKALATSLEPKTLAVFAIVETEQVLSLVGSANFPREQFDCFDLLKHLINQEPLFEHSEDTDPDRTTDLNGDPT